MENEAIIIRDLRNGDWYWIHKVVYENYLDKIGAIGLGVYNALCYYANRQGECFPSLRTISGKLGIAKSTLCKYLDLLEKHELIKKINRQKEEKSNLYILVRLANKDSPKNKQGLVHQAEHNNNDLNKNYSTIKKIKTISNCDNKISIEEEKEGILSLAKLRGKSYARDFFVNKGWDKEKINKILDL